MARLDVRFPLTVVHGKTKRTKPWPLNMNEYLTTHNLKLALVKIAFAAQVEPMLKGKPPFEGPVRLTYTLYRATAHRADISNILCVADKFFSDCLTKTGIIPDDDWSVIQDVRYLWGGIDRSDPRIEVTVEDLLPVPQPQDIPPMKVNIQFDQSDLESLVREKIATDFPGLVGQDLLIQLSEGGVVVTLLPKSVKPALPAPQGAVIGAIASDLPGTIHADADARTSADSIAALDDEPLTNDDRVHSGWVDADGNPVTDPRFIGKTANQIRGIKSSDTRASKKAEEQPEGDTLQRIQAADAAQRALQDATVQRAREEAAQRAQAAPRDVQAASNARDFIRQKLEEAAPANVDDLPLEGFEVPGSKPRETFSPETGIYQPPVKEDTGPTYSEDQPLSFGDDEPLDLSPTPGQELDRQMDEAIAKPEPKAFPPTPLGRMLAESQAKAAQQSEQRGETVRGIFEDISNPAPVEEDEDDARSLFANLMAG